MGILGLSRLIADLSPESIKEIELKSLFGRRIAIDASMCIYQFLIAIRNTEYMMTNDQGETTSHLVGLFYRTIRLLENGIKPVYVFDGKAPQLKCGELDKRAERRTEAKNKLEEAKELQNVQDIQKLNKRLVKVTRKHVEDCKKLLELLGIPIIQAPSEAEAQCVQLCKENLVYAVATEDMDALTFGCPRLIRNLISGQNEKVKEFQISRILDGLNLTQEQFVDLSILMGCDYCDNIRGIGGKKGLELLKKFNNIEGILKNKFGIENYAEVEIEYNLRKINENVKPEELESESQIKDEGDDDAENDENKNDTASKIENKTIDEEEIFSKMQNSDAEEEVDEKDQEEDISPKKTKKQQVVPENWPFKGARQLFQHPLVTANTITEHDLKINDIDEEGMVKFLCVENGFNEERVRKSLKRAKESKNKSQQTRIDSFFKIIPATSPVKKQDNSGKKNKQAQKNEPRNKRGRWTR